MESCNGKFNSRSVYTAASRLSMRNIDKNTNTGWHFLSSCHSNISHFCTPLPFACMLFMLLSDKQSIMYKQWWARGQAVMGNRCTLETRELHVNEGHLFMTQRKKWKQASLLHINNNFCIMHAHQKLALSNATDVMLINVANSDLKIVVSPYYIYTHIKIMSRMKVCYFVSCIKTRKKKPRMRKTL